MLFTAITYLSAVSIKANEIGLPTSTTNIGDAIANIVRLLMSLIGMLAIVFIIVGGLQLVYSTGDPARVKRGRETLIYACVGLVVAIASYAIVTFISNGVK